MQAIKKRSYLVAVLAVLGAAACAPTKNVDTFAAHSVDGPRVVALAGARHPWTSEIEKRLRENGVSVKRFASTGVVSEETGPGRISTYAEASARVVLRVDGYAPNDALNRCFGGGYKFDHITAEVIDTKTNETLATYSNSGYSENCQPLSGTIFTDITKMVVNVFR